jgi:hypothetical protein
MTGAFKETQSRTALRIEIRIFHGLEASNTVALWSMEGFAVFVVREAVE